MSKCRAKSRDCPEMKKLFLKMMEELTTGNAARLETTVDTLCPDLLETAAVKIHELEEWSEEPDMVE